VGARSTFEDGGQDRRRRGEGRRRRETGSEEKRAAGLIKREPATPDPLWMCGWRSRGQTARWIGRLGCSINQETLVIGGTKPFPLPSLSTARLGRSAAGRKGQGFTGHQAQAHTLSAIQHRDATVMDMQRCNRGVATSMALCLLPLFEAACCGTALSPVSDPATKTIRVAHRLKSWQRWFTA